jgi:hypothetical protein
MSKSLVLVLMAVLLTCAAGFAQESAQMGSVGEVRAGEIISFTITLDKAPDFENPAILVVAGPEKGGQPGVQNTALARESKSEYRASLRIPPTADEGVWTVKQVRLFVPAGGTVPLTINPIQFTVRKAGDVELPSSATVALAK